MRPFKLALVQLHVAPASAEQNLRRALELTHEAASNGAELVLLPEALPFGWMDPSAKTRATAIPNGEHCQALQRAAKEAGIFICSGLVERSGYRLFNSAVLIDPAGQILLHHRKINELEIARDLYSTGDRLGVADTSLGRFGLMICADAFIDGQVISRALGAMGARIILSPCAWAVPPGHDNSKTPYGQLWLDNYRPVARAFSLWIAGCSNVGPIQSGPWSGHKCIGCSMIVAPDGEPKLISSYGEAAEEIRCLEIAPTP